MLKVLKASAGSGKTYKLTEFYLLICFQNHEDKFYFRRILAMTFTNDATAEMKERILHALHDLASGKENAPHLEEIMKELGRDEQWVRWKAGQILDAMMEYYDQFSISTIDSFFQRVLKIFTRELDIEGGYELEMNQGMVLDEAMEVFIDTLNKNNPNLQWVEQVLMQLSENQKGTDFRTKLKKLGEELFKEGVEDHLAQLKQDQLLTLFAKIRRLKYAFEEKIRTNQKQVRALLDSIDLNETDFNGGSRSFVNTWLSTYQDFKKAAVDIAIDDKVKKIQQMPDQKEKWITGYQKGGVTVDKFDQIYPQLNELLKEFLQNLESYGKRYLTLREIEKDFPSFGFLTVLESMVQRYCSRERKMLISRTSLLLKKVIQMQLMPFFYEQLGNRYHHILLDEFQDTSVSQWKNLQVLVENAIQTEGNASLIVGDVKQAIYRWRNGDWKILHHQLQDEYGPQGLYQEDPIAFNWRSKAGIVDFNKKLYYRAPAIANDYLHNQRVEQEGEQTFDLTSIYEGHQQGIPKPRQEKSKGGYIEFWGYRPLKNQEDQQEQEYWTHLKESIIDIIDRGYAKRDICILVRKADHGKELGDLLLEWQQQPYGKKYFTFASNEVLQLNKSYAVQALMAFFQLIQDPKNGAAYGEWVQAMSKLHGEGQTDFKEVKSVKESLAEEIKHAKSLTLWEISDRVIERFQLGYRKEEIPFLQYFQELIYAFSQKGKGHIKEWVEWWKEEGEQENLQLSSGQDAIRIMTVHKSKGLEFPIVFFLHNDWGISTANDRGNKQNLVWVKNLNVTDDLFISAFPFNFRSLKNTLSTLAYDSELQAQIVDNLNLLYVATTRPVSELYISLRGTKGDQELKTMADLLYRYADMVKGWSVLSEGTDLIQSVWGAKSKNPEKKETDEPAWSFTSYHGGRPIPPISGRFSRQDFEEEQSEALSRGRKLHKLFEGVSSLKEIRQRLVEGCEEGWIEEQEQAELIQDAENLFHHTEIANLLEAEGELLTEREILLPTGELLRPDRVVIKDNSTLVIDFKTGEKYSKNEQQLLQYQKVLQGMGYPAVKGYLLYLDKAEIVENPPL